MAGRNAAALAQGRPPRVLPRTTAMGALAHYVSHADPAHYQPSNITHGIMEPLPNPPRDKARKKALVAERALADLQAWMGEAALSGR
jgi:methylenetetrahydrofolate--tRNA-(uracil-5-)-methyltransferase